MSVVRGGVIPKESEDVNSEKDNDLETAWLEETTIGGFRVWHIMAIVFGALLSLVIMFCCCMKFRIPRTKQEIEADYQRKQITKKFREKLEKIKNSEMDELDLPKALVKVQTELLSDEEDSDTTQSKSKGNNSTTMTSNNKSNDIQKV